MSLDIKKLIEDDRDTIITLVERNYTTKEIRQEFSYKYTIYQIAGVKAHMTMGTY